LLQQLFIKHGAYEKYLQKEKHAVSRLMEYMTNQNLLEELERLQEILKVSNPHIDFAALKWMVHSTSQRLLS
jgi:hypothetical protein